MRKFLLLLACFCFTNQALANCWDEAGTKYSIDPWLLYSIAQAESSLNSNAINYNKNNSVDHGVMQVNSIWLPKLAQYGINRSSLFDACTSIHVGAWILAQQISKYGYNWVAVGSYHSQTPKFRDKYAMRVFNIYNKNLRANSVVVASK